MRYGMTIETKWRLSAHDFSCLGFYLIRFGPLRVVCAWWPENHEACDEVSARPAHAPGSV
jgi:hypothetical protein